MIHVATRGQDVWLCDSKEAGFSYRVTPSGRMDGKEPNAKRQENGIYNGEFAREVCRRYNYYQVLRETLQDIAKLARSERDDPSDAAFRSYALQVAQDALRDIIGEEVAAQERGAK